MSDPSSRSDLLGGAAWLAFGTLILGESFRMDRFTKMGASLYTMPGFVPGILGSIIALLGMALAWRGWRRAKAVQESSTAEQRQIEGQPEDAGSHKKGAQESGALINQRLGIALPLCLLYAAGLIGRVPFWLATGLFVAIFTYCFTPKGLSLSRRTISALTSGVLTTAVVIAVFQYVFLVRLP
jgi:Tripartite tricarboxylate transporter TctB family